MHVEQRFLYQRHTSGKFTTLPDEFANLPTEKGLEGRGVATNPPSQSHTQTTDRGQLADQRDEK